MCVARENESREWVCVVCPRMLDREPKALHSIRRKARRRLGESSLLDRDDGSNFARLNRMNVIPPRVVYAQVAKSHRKLRVPHPKCEKNRIYGITRFLWRDLSRSSRLKEAVDTRDDASSSSQLLAPFNVAFCQCVRLIARMTTARHVCTCACVLCVNSMCSCTWRKYLLLKKTHKHRKIVVAR